MYDDSVVPTEPTDENPRTVHLFWKEITDYAAALGAHCSWPLTTPPGVDELTFTPPSGLRRLVHSHQLRNMELGATAVTTENGWGEAEVRLFPTLFDKLVAEFDHDRSEAFNTCGIECDPENNLIVINLSGLTPYFDHGSTLVHKIGEGFSDTYPDIYVHGQVMQVISTPRPRS